MRRLLMLLTLLVGSGCYCSHSPSPTRDAGGTASDGGRDGGAPRDAGYDAGWDASVFVPPPGVCTPELSRDRFPGDTQRNRDDSQARAALFRECSPGEGCTGASFTVGADGRVESVTPIDGADPGCIQSALVGLCLPSYRDDGGEAVACGV